MKRTSLFAALALAALLAGGARAQSSAMELGPGPTLPHPTGKWSLQECIAYAVEHNISVAQNRLRMEQSQVDYSTAKRNRLPTLNASLSGNMNFGRGQDREGVMQDKTSFSSSAGLSTGIPVFAGLRIKHNIEAARLNLVAALDDLERVAEEVSLSVTSFYLQVLFNKEMVAVAESQQAISARLVEVNQTRFAAGKIPESDLVESRSQLARDTYNLVQQRNTLELSLLDLKQMLNLEASVSFDAAIPLTGDLEMASMAPRESINAIYDYALGTRPVIRGEENRLQASLAGIRAAKSQLYPQISASAGYSNGYYYTFSSGIPNSRLMDQLKNNGNEYIGLSMSIPIFNRGITRNQIRSATLSSDAQELTLLQARQTLRKEIEQAYYTATSAYSQYIASRESADAARKSFVYEQEKSAAGVSTLYDFDLAKTRLETAESEMVRAKYEYIFRTKVLQFYLGEALAFDY